MLNVQLRPQCDRIMPEDKVKGDVFHLSQIVCLDLDGKTISGRRLQVDHMTGRNALERLSAEKSNDTAYISLQEDLPKYSIRPGPIGEVFEENLPDMYLWKFDELSFSTSLSLIDKFGFIDDSTPALKRVIEMEFPARAFNQKWRIEKVAATRAHLERINGVSPIIIIEFHHLYLKCRFRFPPVKGYQSLFDDARKFNELEFQQKYDGPDDGDMWRVYRKHGVFTVGF
jgi:hypothetical protein